MRLLDADILAYALYDESPAHQDSWQYLENHIKQGNKIHITLTTILETYNTLYWYYHIRPRTQLLEKMRLTLELLEPIQTSLQGIAISQTMNIPLGDGFLIAAAKQNNIPIIVSNDKHIAKTATKQGLVYENPITDKTRKKLSDQTPEQ